MDEQNQQAQTSTPTKEKPGSKTLIIGLVAIVLVGLGYFLLKRLGGYQTPAPATIEQILVTQEPVVEEGRGEAREITVEGDEFSFSPSALSLTAGETVRLTFKNIGNSPHNFSVEGTDIVTQTIPPGGTTTLEFDVPETGTYTFYCSVGNHRALGMEGDLEVE